MRSTVSAAEIRATTLTELEVATALVKAHWAEVALNKELMVLDPDWDRYRTLDAAGMLVALGAYVENVLIGYSLGFVGRHLHYRGLTYYHNDVLFVAPEHRRSRVGLDLIEKSEAAAEAQGARFFCWHAKKDTALDRLLDHRGYQVQDIIYSRGSV